MKNLLVAQSGGPTAAINATLSGVLDAAKKSSSISKIYGARNGIQGVLRDTLVELTNLVTQENLELLRRTPAAALGSCRYMVKDWKEDETDYQKIVEVFRKYNIGYFIYIGGNDSMDTVRKLSEYCTEKEIDDIVVVGAPKTIDNDLALTDHCPGFGSAAKYIATIMRELEREVEVYTPNNVLIVEMMGRHAGWLTASAALAQQKSKKVPYLIYLEERSFSMEKFISDVKNALKQYHAVLVAVSEGLHDANGKFICESDDDLHQDVFGHKQLSGTGKVLECAVKEQIGCKVRSIEVNLLQRCAAHQMSATDNEESWNLGAYAVKIALQKKSGKMSALRRVNQQPYQVEYEEVDVKDVANVEKKVPDAWINEEGNGVTQEMIAYLNPLIQGEMECCYEDGLPNYFIIE